MSSALLGKFRLLGRIRCQSSGHTVHLLLLASEWRVVVGPRQSQGSSSPLQNSIGQFEVLLTSLPQHSGRSGKIDLSHPPPSA